MFVPALFTIAKTWMPESLGGCLSKENVVYTHTHYYSAIKKKETLPFATTRTDLEGIMLSKTSQTDIYHLISLIYGIKK